MLWIGWIKLKPSSNAVLMGGLLYLACLMWVIFQAFYGAIEQSASTGGASFDAGARDIMLVSAAALVPVVINLWLGVRSQGQGSAHRGAYTYLAPAIVGMAVLVFIPFVLGVGLAFFRHENGVFHWVGLHNFLVILSNEGLSFTHPLSFYFTLGVTILWTAINVLLHASFGLLLALLLNSSDLKFKGVYRVLLIVPWAVPSYITALIWHGMFESNGGVINRVLIEVGLSEVAWFDGFWSRFLGQRCDQHLAGLSFHDGGFTGGIAEYPSIALRSRNSRRGESLAMFSVYYFANVAAYANAGSHSRGDLDI